MLVTVIFLFEWSTADIFIVYYPHNSIYTCKWPQWQPCLKKAPFRPQTEKQLLNRIDHSIAQIGKGAYTDSEEFEKEMLAGISVI